MTYETQAGQFAAEGYTVFDGLLAGAPLELLRAECARFVAREDARMDAAGVDRLGLSVRGKRYFANECQREQPSLRTVLFGEAMANVCRATLGADAYFFFDQYVVKGPDAAAANGFGWHQDSGYMSHDGGPPDHAPYLTCWCPLDDATVENGTVRVLPRTHKDGIVAHERTGADLQVKTEDPGVVIEAKAGDVVAFSSRLLHATGANRTDAPRRVYLAQYSPEAILDPGTRHLRRNAIAFLRDGRRVTFA
jgi:ectoine hydroxylase-related dioxygenase (phytanoyl-CoA dioxygenase family)